MTIGFLDIEMNLCNTLCLNLLGSMRSHNSEANDVPDADSHISVGNINEAKTETVRHNGQGFWNISKGQFGSHGSWIFYPSQRSPRGWSWVFSVGLYSRVFLFSWQ